MNIDAIVIHYKEANHTARGEVLSISYNQLVLDKVILQVLFSTDVQVPKTREEFGMMYITKYKHDKELKLAIE